jgi:DNA-directed RNA polymerase sigma subunit (sigma70/sigma32)
MTDDTPLLIEDLRKKVHTLLSGMTPVERKALRVRFGIDVPGMVGDDDDSIRAIARILARLKKKR